VKAPAGRGLFALEAGRNPPSLYLVGKFAASNFELQESLDNPAELLNN
jgi:hypothetical protein